MSSLSSVDIQESRALEDTLGELSVSPTLFAPSVSRWMQGAPSCRVALASKVRGVPTPKATLASPAIQARQVQPTSSRPVVGHSVGRLLDRVKTYTSHAWHAQSRHEQAYLLAKGNPTPPATPLRDVLPWTYTGNELHPTQKPVDSLRSLIETYCPPGGVVLDPFAGSGTTGAAARQAGRRFVLIEKDPDYHGKAAKRLTK